MKTTRNEKKGMIWAYSKNLAILCAILGAIIMLSASCSSTEGIYRIIDSSQNIYAVDINAKTSTRENPVSFELEAGTYTVTVIGTSKGGTYNAWRFWFLRVKKNKKGEWVSGWINKYSYSSKEFTEVTLFDGKIYGTPETALANAKNSEFTLKNKARVNFYIVDSPYFDNRGGISLLITPKNEQQ